MSDNILLISGISKCPNKKPNNKKWKKSLPLKIIPTIKTKKKILNIKIPGPNLLICSFKFSVKMMKLFQKISSLNSNKLSTWKIMYSLLESFHLRSYLALNSTKLLKNFSEFLMKKNLQSWIKSLMQISRIRVQKIL